MESQEKIIMKFKLGQPVEISVNGVKGTACRAFSKPFEDIVGGKVLSDEPTAEMSQTKVKQTAEVQQHV